MIAAILLGAASLAVPPDELQEQLARLAAPRAFERAAAERWLEAHLGYERCPAVAHAARDGDAEVRGRLARILGADDRHLALALQLCGEDDPVVSGLGRDAVRASVARSRPELRAGGRREGVEILLRQAASGSPPRSVVFDSREPLERLCAALELVGDLSLGLTLDPRVATLANRRGARPVTGAWNDALLEAAQELGLVLEIHGLGPRPNEPEGAFLFFGPKGAPPRTGVELLGEWLFTLAQPGADAAGAAIERRLAARNLIACGYTPAIDWMERLVRAGDDPAALDGLLAAASKGLVAGCLLEPARIDALLDLLQDPGESRGPWILRALSSLGCLDATGQPLAPCFLDGFDRLGPRGRWARLHVLEQGGCALEGLDALVRPLLADPGSPPELRLQALFTLAVRADPGAPPPQVADPDRLFELELDDARVEHLGRALESLGLEPPFRDPSAFHGSLEARARLLEAWLWRGEVEPLATQLVAWLADPRWDGHAGEDALASLLRRWTPRGGLPRIDAALTRARSLAPARARALDRVRLMLGLVPAEEVPRTLAEGHLDDGSTDVGLLAALVGYPRKLPEPLDSRVGTALLGLAAGTPGARDPGILRALESAAQGLFAAGRDQDGNAFVGRVRRVLRSLGGAGPDLGLWPTAPFLEPLDVARALRDGDVPASLRD